MPKNFVNFIMWIDILNLIENKVNKWRFKKIIKIKVSFFKGLTENIKINFNKY